MTVGTKIKNLMGDLTKIQASLESYSIEANDQKAKQAFTKGEQLTHEVIDAMTERVKEIEKEEPQFKL